MAAGHSEASKMPSGGTGSNQPGFNLVTALTVGESAGWVFPDGDFARPRARFDPSASADTVAFYFALTSECPTSQSPGELWYSPQERHSEEEIIMTPKATSIMDVAEAFFDACETGKGWEVCRAYCTPNATFSAQAEPLLDVKTLVQYTDWMKGMLTVLPDARYEVKSFATDNARNNVCAYGIFYGTHTGQGGPVLPTGRRIATDYVYVMQF
jgi:hypothetical protein